MIGKGYVNSENDQMASTDIIFMYIHISHKAAKSIAKLIDQSCGELRLAVCLSSHLKTTEHSWMSDKPQKQASAKAT